MSIKLFAATAVAFGAVLALPAGIASADSGITTDATGDTSASSDIQRMTIDNYARDDQFQVRVKLTEVVIGSSLTIFVDRSKANAGPELRMVAFPDSEWQLFRVGSFGEHGRRIDTCGRVQFSDSTPRPVATWTSTRSCLNIDGRVRAAAKLVDADGHHDWVPDARKFSGWVTEGPMSAPVRVTGDPS